MSRVDPTLLLGESSLVERLESALARAPRHDGAELAYEGGIRRHARFDGRGALAFEEERFADVRARVCVDGRVGRSAVGGTSPEALATALALATNAARALARSPRGPGLPSPRPLRRMSTFAFDEETAALESEAKVELLAPVLAAAARDGATFAGHFHTQIEERAVVSTLGVRAHHAGTRADASLIAERDGATGFAGGVAKSARALDLASLAERALEKARRAGSPVALAAGAYDVVLEPAAVAEALEWLALVGLTARSVEDGASFAADGLGRRVTGPRVELWDEGASDDPLALPLPFDAEGLPKIRLPLLSRGVLVGVAHDHRSAERAGRASTGHATLDLASGEELAVATHLFLGAGDETARGLVERVERGVYVTRFHYVSGALDPRRGSMTGTTRDGTFLIEEGRLGRALAPARWSEDLLAALARIVALSSERRATPSFFGRGVTVAPFVLLRGWRFL